MALQTVTVPADINSQVVAELVENYNRLAVQFEAFVAAATHGDGQTAVGLLTDPKTVTLYPSPMPKPTVSFPS
jgi:hypothetical protein